MRALRLWLIDGASLRRVGCKEEEGPEVGSVEVAYLLGGLR